MDYIMLLVAKSVIDDRMHEADAHRLAARAGSSRRRLRPWHIGRQSVPLHPSTGCASS